MRWGIISTARIARNWVIPATQLAGQEVLAIASRDAATASVVAAQHGIARSYGSYEALLADPDVDAVYIGLPNHLHKPWTIAAARAGKHVLCEKPLALDESEAAEMIAECEAAGVVMMEAFMYRTHPQWALAHDLVDSGRIGELKAVQTWFSYYNDDPANVRAVPEWGGGALYDIGCYAIDVARWFLGERPDEVHGIVQRDPVMGIDTTTAGHLRFGDRTASFTVSMRTQPGQRVELHGTRGRVTVEIPFNAPADRPCIVRLTTGGATVDAVVETFEVPTTNQYATQAAAFAAAVAGTAPLPVPHSSSLANMAAICAIGGF